MPINIVDLDSYFQEHKRRLDQCLSGTKWLLQQFQSKRPKVYVEIGAASLKTFRIYESNLPKEGLAIGIDINPNTPEEWANYKTASGCELGLISRSSIEPSTVASVTTLLDGRGIDWLFIDGDHHFNTVKEEWRLYSPLMSPDGVVLFHDCDPEPGKKVLDSGEEDLTGQGAGMMYHILQKQGYNIRLSLNSAIGTGFLQL